MHACSQHVLRACRVPSTWFAFPCPVLHSPLGQVPLPSALYPVGALRFAEVMDGRGLRNTGGSYRSQDVATGAKMEKTCKLEFQLCRFLAVWTWVDQAASLSLDFHIRKWGQFHGPGWTAFGPGGAAGQASLGARSREGLPWSGAAGVARLVWGGHCSVFLWRAAKGALGPSPSRKEQRRKGGGEARRA